MPKLEAITPVRSSGQMGELSLLRGFSFFVTPDFADVASQNCTNCVDDIWLTACQPQDIAF